MNILVLIGSYFPSGVALSARIRNFCELFSSLGHSVHVIALYSKNAMIEQLDFCSYEVVSKKGSNSMDSFFGDSHFIDSTIRFIDEHKVDVVLGAGIDCYVGKLIKLTKRRNIPLIIEECEWMDNSSYRFKTIDYRKIRRDYLFRFGYKRVQGIIVISELLQKHFSHANIRTIKIPTILNCSQLPFSYETNNEKIKIVYTGNPGKSKEFILPILEALVDDEVFQKKIEFHIYGPSLSTILTNIEGKMALIERLKNTVMIHGYVPQDQIPQMLTLFDFQIFIRPQRRSSNAGFPTKLAESFAAGVPVITNDTGDISLYLSDGKSGYILANNNKEAVKEVFYKILRMDQTEKIAMRKEARERAKLYFDYNNYSEQINAFLEGSLYEIGT